MLGSRPPQCSSSCASASSSLTAGSTTFYRWLIGEFPTEALAVQQDPTVNYFRSDQAGETVNLYRQHHSALHGYLLYRAQNPPVAPNHLNVLAGTRIEMHRGGLWLPSVPDDVRDALREPLLAWGYRKILWGSSSRSAPPVPCQVTSARWGRREGLDVQAVRLP